MSKGLTIALVGNPNCGKTTLFNDLTGAHQKVGNWPGVTVEKKSGTFSLFGDKVEIVDLPGIYSLEQDYLGLDEKIAREYLSLGDIDLIINIVDASNLQRNLILTQQLLETGIPVVVALNMLDVAKQQGVEVDAQSFSEKLGVPVAPIIASHGTGIKYLRELIVRNPLTKRSVGHVGSAQSGNRNGTRKYSTGPYAEEDSTEQHSTEEHSVGEKLIKRYHQAERLTSAVVQMTPVEHTPTERIDGWVLNRWLGIPFFLAMMYLMFTIAINLGAVFIDFFDILFGALLVDSTRALLTFFSAPAWLTVLLADGLGGGIQLVATFIPVIGFLFLCLSILEDSGYMARAAFVIDRLMSKLGLPGSAFVPLIVGFGCNVPSIMAARSLGRDSDRLLTIAMAPFMSCGARLTVYALFAAAFFPTNGQNVVFFLYLLGIAMAVATGWIFRKQIFDTEITPSFQEMPAYHIPVLRNILLTTWFRLKSFIFRAGKTIVLVVIALSFLNSIGTNGDFGNEDTEDSVLALIGKKITPVFVPLGLKEENWAASVGLITGLFAKEAVVGTLDALYSGPGNKADDSVDLLSSMNEAFNSILVNGSELLGNLGDPLGLDLGDLSDTSVAAQSQGVNTSTLTNMATLFGGQFEAFCYLVFVLLYSPCVAVLGAINKEAGWRWMLLVFSWTVGLGYLTATTIYQVGTFSAHPVFSLAWLAGSAVAFFIVVQGLKTIGRRSIPGNLIPVVQLN
jgi:ferrous iron transport protein B